jgi:hypothetical protein
MLERLVGQLPLVLLCALAAAAAALVEELLLA